MMAKLWFWVRSYVAHWRGLLDLKRGRYVTLDELEWQSVDDPYCND